MVKFGRWVVKFRVPIIIISLLLMIPATIGMISTRVNYDMLTYLPEDMETVQGQDILLDDFGKGAFSLVIIEGMEPKDISALKSDIKKIDHVESVIWYDDIADITVPMEAIPKKYYDVFNSGDATIVAVFFDTSTSADETMDAITAIRNTVGDNCFVTGMSAMVTDLKELCEQEEPIYVAIAVILATVIMMIFMDSWTVPFVFLLSIGMAILLNLGSNFFMGEISYITKALSAVLQLAVTMDYSIFLWHSYSEQKLKYDDKKEAMAQAISATLTSVVGSSLTTVAGFLAMCFMSFTLGADLGIVMAKGVVFGVIGCVTILPSLILVLDKVLEKTKHRPIIPKVDKLAAFVTKRWWIFLTVFVVVLVPAFIGQKNAAVYYNLGDTLPEDMDYVISNTKLEEEFDLGSTHMVLVDSSMSQKNMKKMMNEIDNVDGVKATLGLSSVVGSLVPEDILPESVTEILKGDKYELLLISSEYKTASDEVNNQITDINSIIKNYDENGMLIGEAPCTKDLITVTDHDFKVVDIISIAAIFVIIFLVLKSASLPFILVATIEFAIFINLGIPFYTSTELPFIAPICISTIQLGSTVDYAILMTTRYKTERIAGKSKTDSIQIALSTSIPSILVSAFGFFAATFGVGIYSNVDIISALCNLMARGAIVSMLSVIFILPSFFVLFDKLIMHTTLGFKHIRKATKAKAKVTNA